MIYKKVAEHGSFLGIICFADICFKRIIVIKIRFSEPVLLKRCDLHYMIIHNFRGGLLLEKKENDDPLNQS